jgi:hypothetical protein
MAAKELRSNPCFHRLGLISEKSLGSKETNCQAATAACLLTLLGWIESIHLKLEDGALWNQRLNEMGFGDWIAGMTYDMTRRYEGSKIRVPCLVLPSVVWYCWYWQVRHAYLYRQKKKTIASQPSDCLLVPFGAQDDFWLLIGFAVMTVWPSKTAAIEQSLDQTVPWRCRKTPQLLFFALVVMAWHDDKRSAGKVKMNDGPRHIHRRCLRVPTRMNLSLGNISKRYQVS